MIGKVVYVNLYTPELSVGLSVTSRNDLFLFANAMSSWPKLSISAAKYCRVHQVSLVHNCIDMQEHA